MPEWCVYIAAVKPITLHNKPLAVFWCYLSYTDDQADLRFVGIRNDKETYDYDVITETLPLEDIELKESFDKRKEKLLIEISDVFRKDMPKVDDPRTWFN